MFVDEVIKVKVLVFIFNQLSCLIPIIDMSTLQIKF